MKLAEAKWAKGSGQVAKQDQKRVLRVTVFPQGSGQPYEEDVQPDNEGKFDTKEAGTFVVARGSVWRGRDGIYRGICHEGVAHTINASTFRGDEVMHPRALHSIAHNNLVAQFDTLQRSRGLWRQAGTYGLILALVGLVLVGIWMVQSIGGGLEGLQQAIEGLELRTGDGGAGDASATPPGAHNDIAPIRRDA